MAHPVRAFVPACALAIWPCLPGCATEPAPVAPVSPSPKAEPLPPASSGPPPKPATLDPTAAREETARIMAEVAQARKLAAPERVATEVIDHQGIRDFARTSLYEHTTPERLKLLARIDSSLGIIPVGADGEQVLLELLELGVLGLYDPKRKTLFIGDFVPTPMLSMVVGHEIVHGLQDRHFDLQRLQVPMDHESDAEAARTFMVEGDAQAAYLAWVSGSRGLSGVADDVFRAMGDQALSLASATPYPVLARQIQLPYADGAGTITRLARERGWTAVDALYGKLPETTEQMLHVDKLIAREPAIAVTVAPGPVVDAFPGLVAIWHDTLGEASLLSMLAQVEPATVARAAAAGWGGGGYQAFDDPKVPFDAPLVVGGVQWDSEREAEQFEPSFTRYLEQQMPGEFWLQRRRDLVLFAVRIPATIDRGALAEAALAAVKPGKRRASR